MKLIDIKEVSEMIGVKKPTIYEWVRTGKIPFRRLNGLIRFDPDEINEWVESQKTYDKKGRVSHKKTCKNKDLDSIVTNAIEAGKGTRYNHPQRGNQTIQAKKGGKDGTF
jgi:excisionase family DNA binding protein